MRHNENNYQHHYLNDTHVHPLPYYTRNGIYFKPLSVFIQQRYIRRRRMYIWTWKILLFEKRGVYRLME